MPDLLRTLVNGLAKLARRAAEIVWYTGFPIIFFNLLREVLHHWRAGTFSGEDAFGYPCIGYNGVVCIPVCGHPT